MADTRNDIKSNGANDALFFDGHGIEGTGRITHPKVFISYSWTSKKRAVALADRLISNGVQVVIDVYDLKEGMDKYAFMQKIVNDDSIEKVLILCDKTYRDKANKFKGGVGDEAMIISPEIYGKVDQQKFIPIVLENEEGKPCLPTFAKSRIYIDFSDRQKEANAFEQLVRNLWGMPDRRRPELGKRPSWLDGESVDTIVLQDQIHTLDDVIRISPDPDSILHRSAFEFTNILNKITKGGDADFNLVSAIKDTEPVRNCYIDLVERLIQVDGISGEHIGSLIEALYNGIVCHDFAVSECFHFFFWDIFICTAALLLCYEKYGYLHQLLDRTYFLRDIIGSNNDPRAYTFSRFRQYIRNLEGYYKQQINPRLVSLAADMLTKREHGQCITMRNLVVADTTLAHLAMLYGKADFTWYPALAPYSDYAGYGLIWERLPSMTFCRKLFPLFDVKSFEEFKLAIKEMSDAWNAAEVIQRSSIWFGGIRPVLGDGDFEKIGTLP